MPDIKAHMKVILLNRRGRANAIKRKELLHLLGLPDMADRQMRELKRKLIAEGIPVLSCSSDPGGYYVPDTFAELKEGIDNIRSYLIEEARCIRDLKVKGKYFLGPEQPQLL